MKVIKESKMENLPIDFITSFVSKGWEEVGNLKASIDGIKQTFKGTKDVEEILQDLVDSYLIALGRMEAHLDNKNYIDLPTNAEIKEALTEDVEPIEFKNVDVEIKPNEDNIIVNDFNIDAIKDNFNPPDYDKEVDNDIGTDVFQSEDFADFGKDVNLKDHEVEPFEYFADFDDIKPDDTEESPRQQWLNRL